MSEALREKCEAVGQGQLLHFWSQLNEVEKQSLTTQIETLDLNRINRIYQRAIQFEKGLQADSNSGHDAPINPLPEEAFDSTIGESVKEDQWRSIGLKAIGEGQIGVLLMAGGQGTRLGSSAPKGCYDIGLPSHKSLFALQAERIARLQILASASHSHQKRPAIIPWYIMTSGPTRKDTESFFKENAFFGLDPSNVIFFEQGTLPCLTMDGKIILDEPSKIAVAPDGNGGLYAALRSNIHPGSSHTVMKDIEKRNILYVHAYGVDNCLVRVADPVFIGCGISKNADCAVKVVRKTSPSESVGVVAMRGTKYSVVEYSEISQEQSERRDPKTGELAFRAANIANHFYTTKFLESVASFEDQLAFHIARKKIPYVDEQSSQLVKPTKPNGMKLELFVFDVFPFAKKFAVMEVDRMEEFSPLKNARGTGTDDPDTSRRDIISQHRRFLEKAGAYVADDVDIELSPLVTYAGEGLDSIKGKKFLRLGIASTLEDLDALQ